MTDDVRLVRMSEKTGVEGQAAASATDGDAEIAESGVIDSAVDTVVTDGEAEIPITGVAPMSDTSLAETTDTSVSVVDDRYSVINQLT